MSKTMTEEKAREIVDKRGIRYYYEQYEFLVITETKRSSMSKKLRAEYDAVKYLIDHNIIVAYLGD